MHDISPQWGTLWHALPYPKNSWKKFNARQCPSLSLGAASTGIQKEKSSMDRWNLAEPVFALFMSIKGSNRP
jgi:hypothetical protein